MVGKGLKTLNISTIEDKPMYEHIKEVWNSGVSKYIKFAKCWKSKKSLWLNIQILRMDNNEMIVMFDDVTEILENRKKLEDSNKQKSVFLSNMSHEIRSPVNSIMGFADLLLGLDDERTRREYVDIIINSSGYLLKLIDDILDMSKIEAGKISISKKNFDVNDKMKEIYFTNKNKIKKGINFILMTPIENLKIFNDDYRFMQVFINLINNAIKFTDQGEIEMGYFKKDNFIVFYVKDTGMGIKDEDKDKIFKRYEQVQKSSKIGTGLGLSISSELVKILGGEMWLETHYGIGSTFFFKLPISKRISGIDKKPRTEIVESIDLTGKNILLVEDNDYNTKLIKSYLEPTNANVIVAVDGNEALIKYNENKNNIDFILMDIQIPEMDGNEVTQIIRTIDESTPIIAQTAFAMKEEVDDIMQNGFDDIIRKPIRKEELYKVLSRHL
jgi:CheY-like chemotaxis protein/nitrogen-specific signal transduction histidine kinase